MKTTLLKIKRVHLLFAGIAVLTGLLRFINLGAAPLSEAEALLALEAAEGTPHASAGYPLINASGVGTAYRLVTHLIFQGVGAGEAAARIFPALAGFALVLTPWLARKRIGWTRVVALSFLLSVSPIFLTASRTASEASLGGLGVMIAAMTLLGAEGQYTQKNLFLAGSGLGLVLMSGTVGLHGLFSLLLALIMMIFLGVFDKQELRKKGKLLGRLLSSAIFLSILISGGLGLTPGGVASYFNTFAAWLQGWSNPGAFSWGAILAIIPLYAPALFLITLFGVFTAGRPHQREEVGALIWFLLGWVWLLIYPGRHAQHLVILGLPLAFLASGYLVRFVESMLRDRSWSAMQAMVFVFLVLLAFAFLQVVIAHSAADEERILRLGVAGATLAFSGIIAVLFGLGWSWAAARNAAGATIIALGFVFALSTSWRLNFSPRLISVYEWLSIQRTTAGLELLVETVENISIAETGTKASLTLEFAEPPSPALAWALRDYALFDHNLEVMGKGAPIVITRATQDRPGLEDDYLGQTVTIGEDWSGTGAFPPNFLTWFVTRKAPSAEERWLLLVRKDLAILESGDLDIIRAKP
jgi:hypothetical protein